MEGSQEEERQDITRFQEEGACQEPVARCGGGGRDFRTLRPRSARLAECARRVR